MKKLSSTEHLPLLSETLILSGFAGAGGENRTHDLPLTKGLRYHYATPASGSEFARPVPITQPFPQEKGMKALSEKRKERLAAALRANLRRRKTSAGKVARKPNKPLSPESRREEATKEH